MQMDACDETTNAQSDKSERGRSYSISEEETWKTLKKLVVPTVATADLSLVCLPLSQQKQIIPLSDGLGSNEVEGNKPQSREERMDDEVRWKFIEY